MSARLIVPSQHQRRPAASHVSQVQPAEDRSQNVTRNEDRGFHITSQDTIFSPAVNGTCKLPQACRVRGDRRLSARVWTMAACAVACVLHGAAGQQPSEPATSACATAATRAERVWQIPTGLLAAIGIVESGRRAPPATVPIIWPWTINAEGSGIYRQSKAEAVATVRALQRRGVAVIDVGCFQVDLAYHPFAFASLEEAFDPDANAHAAARILSLGRLGSTGWDGAIAAYHSAVPLRGAPYAQRVRAVWPWTRAHPSWGEREPAEAYAVLLSSQARLVRVVTPDTAWPAQPIVPPRTGPPDRLDQADQADSIQLLHPPVEPLPVVLSPTESARPAPR